MTPTLSVEGVHDRDMQPEVVVGAVRPDGTLLCYQPYGRPGLLVADMDLSEATRLLASRCKPL